MHISILTLTTLTLPLLTTAFHPIQPLLQRRQSVLIPCSEYGEKDCGELCIALTATCCPDQSGGCPSGSDCERGSNGEYGCCPVGENCVGPGGANTFNLPPQAPTFTFTNDVIPSASVGGGGVAGPGFTADTDTLSFPVPDRTTTSTTTTSSDLTFETSSIDFDSILSSIAGVTTSSTTTRGIALGPETTTTDLPSVGGGNGDTSGDTTQAAGGGGGGEAGGAGLVSFAFQGLLGAFVAAVAFLL